MCATLGNAIYHTIPVEEHKRPKDLKVTDFYLEKPPTRLTPGQSEYARKQNGKRINRAGKADATAKKKPRGKGALDG